MFRVIKQSLEKYAAELNDLFLCFSRSLHVLHCKIIHFHISVFFSSLAGGLFSVFPRTCLCRDIKSFQQGIFCCCGDTLLLAFCFFFMHGGDGLHYQWKPRNNDVLITSVLTHEGVLSAVRIPLCWWAMCLWSLQCCCTASRRGDLVMRSWRFREVGLLLLKRFKNFFFFKAS